MEGRGRRGDIGGRERRKEGGGRVGRKLGRYVDRQIGAV